MGERLANFYDNMDQFYTLVDKNHADYRKLGQAVQRMLELVNQAVGSPDTSVDQESIFNREVSPDLDVNAGLAVAQYASSSVGIGQQKPDKISPSVRAILSDFGTSKSPAEEYEEEDGSDEDDDDGILIESSTSVNATPIDNNVNVGGEVIDNKARISLSPDHEKDSSPQDADERKDFSTNGTESFPSLTIDPSIKWKKVFSVLTQNGWKWKNGNIAYEKVLVKPGCNFKGGQLGQDFFPTDGMGHGDEIKEYMKENYGWVGEIQESSSSEGSDAQIEASGEDDDCEFGDDAESEGDQMVDDATNSGGQSGISEEMDVPKIVETKNPYDVFEFKDDDENADVTDYGYMPWMLVWQSMQLKGWRVASGSGDGLHYLRPGVESLQGEYGDAFVYEDDVKNIAKTEFGWKGEKPLLRPSAKRNAVVSAEKPSKKHKKVSPSSENSNPSKKHNSSVKTSQKKSSWAAKKKRTDDDKGRTWGKARKTAATSPELLTWKSLKEEGWTAKRAGKINKLHDWYYIRPGFSLSKGTKLNEHYFEDEGAAIKYATDHLNKTTKSPFSSSNASPHSAQVPSSQPASPLETDCVMEGTDDSSTNKLHRKRQDSLNGGQDSVHSQPLADSSFVSKMKPTWKSLQDYEGWIVKSARRYNNLHDWYYIRPGFSPSEDTTEGVHFFLNHVDAVEYAEAHQEECLKNHPGPSDCESSEHSQSSVASESLANLSRSAANESPVNVPSSRPKSPVISEKSDSSSEKSDYEPFALAGDHESWWLNDAMPKFMKHVWKLMRKIGVKYRGDEYVTADGRVSGSVETMQVHFCQEGLPPAAFSTLAHKEIQILSRFASLAHMPRKVGKYHLNSANSIEILRHLPGGPSFDNADAWIVLCEQFGARIVDDAYIVDCIGNEVKDYESVQDIREAIRAYGIKRTCGNDVDLDEHHVALLLWASVLPLPVQKSAETESTHNESQTNKVELATLQTEEEEERTEGELVCATDSIIPESKEIEVPKILDDMSEHALPEYQDAEMLKDTSCANTTKSTTPRAEVADTSKSETQSNAPELPLPEPEPEPESEAESSTNEVGIVDSAVPPEANNPFIDYLEESEEELAESNGIVPETQDDGSDKEQDDACTYNADNENEFTETICSKNIDNQTQMEPASWNPTADVEGNNNGWKSNFFDTQSNAYNDDGDDDEPDDLYKYLTQAIEGKEELNINLDVKDESQLSNLEFSPNVNNANVSSADEISNALNPPHEDYATNLNVRKNLFENLNLN